jgi:hypothetical protein
LIGAEINNYRFKKKTKTEESLPKLEKI